MNYELEKMKREQQEKFDALEAQNENLTRLLQSVKTQTQESGEEEDIDIGSVENFEHEEIDYAIFRLESGFFATQGHCYCENQTFLSESSVEGEELECASCGNIFSIVSGDPISDLELPPLKTYDIYEEDGNIYLNL